MLPLWYAQQHFNKDNLFGFKKDKRKDEAGEKREKKETQRETNEGGRRGIIQHHEGQAKMNERKRGMMRGEMRGDSDEQAITMTD